MPSRDQFTFLDAKRKLLQPLIEPVEAQMLEMLYSRLTEVGLEKIPAESQGNAFREMDRKLERLIVEWVVKEDEATIRATLTQKFGFSSFGAEPTKVLKRILRTKTIQNEAEAKLVLDFLSGSHLGWDTSEKKLKTLSEILARYDSRPKPPSSA